MSYIPGFIVSFVLKVTRNLQLARPSAFIPCRTFMLKTHVQVLLQPRQVMDSCMWCISSCPQLSCVHDMSIRCPQVMSPFLFKSTKRLLSESFASDSAELPRRIAANVELYGLIRAAEQQAIWVAGRRGNDMHTLSCASEVLQKLPMAGHGGGVGMQ